MQRREVFTAHRGVAERLADRPVCPDQRFLEVDLVVGAELRRGLPVLVVETGPTFELLAHRVDVDRGHVRHLDLERNALVLPLEKGGRRVGAPVIEAIGQVLGVRRCDRIHRHAQHIVFRVVLIRSPAGVARQDPGPRAGLLELQEQRVGSCLDIALLDLHIVRERDRRAFVGTRSPGRGRGRSEAFVEQPVWDHLAPDVAGAIGRARLHAGAVIRDGDLHRADPLRDLGSLASTVAARRQRQLGQLLAERGAAREQDHRGEKQGAHGRRIAAAHRENCQLLALSNPVERLIQADECVRCT